MVLVVCGAIGESIADRRGRSSAGFVLGAVLGPVGWVLAARLEPSYEVLSERQTAASRAGARSGSSGRSRAGSGAAATSPTSHGSDARRSGRHPSELAAAGVLRKPDPIFTGTGSRESSSEWTVTPRELGELRREYGAILQTVVNEVEARDPHRTAVVDATLVGWLCEQVRNGTADQVNLTQIIADRTGLVATF